MNTVNVLQQSSLEYRINFVTLLINNCVAKVSHLDVLRQNNFVATIAVFAGIFGFILQSKNWLVASIASTILFVFMYIFLLIEKNLHKYSEAWQSTLRKLTFSLQDLINEPNRDYAICRYDIDREKGVRFKGYKATVHKLLLLGGPIAFVIFLLQRYSHG